MRFLAGLVLAFILALSAGCGGSNSSTLASATVTAAANDCSLAGQEAWVYQDMQDVYLWYQHMPALDPTQFTSLDDLLAGITYKQLDRFSYINTQAEETAYYSSSQYVGFGFEQVLVAATDPRIAEVFPGSPAEQGGLARGDKLLAVDGTSVVDLINQGTYDNAFGASTIGLQRTVTYQDLSGAQHTVTLTKAVITIPTVPVSKVIDTGSHKVGYLVFSNFVQPSFDSLSAAFADFKSKGVDRLVVDLRYNGGGLLSVAQYLGSLIGGTQTTGRVFAKLTYNDKQSGSNQTLDFNTPVNALGLDQVVFITTGGTASASEAVINSLKPFIGVTLIGSTTYGKPVGFNGQNFCADVLHAVTFAMTNAAGSGDYYSGFAPDCPAADDLSHPLGDTSEGSLAAALQYIGSGACPVVRSSQGYVPRLAPPARRYDFHSLTGY